MRQFLYGALCVALATCPASAQSSAQLRLVMMAPVDCRLQSVSSIRNAGILRVEFRARCNVPHSIELGILSGGRSSAKVEIEGQVFAVPPSGQISVPGRSDSSSSRLLKIIQPGPTTASLTRLTIRPALGA